MEILRAVRPSAPKKWDTKKVSTRIYTETDNIPKTLKATYLK